MKTGQTEEKTETETEAETGAQAVRKMEQAKMRWKGKKGKSWQEEGDTGGFGMKGGDGGEKGKGKARREQGRGEGRRKRKEKEGKAEGERRRKDGPTHKQLHKRKWCREERGECGYAALRARLAVWGGRG